jgi:heat shock protein HslJ
MKTLFISLAISTLLVAACTQKVIEAASANVSLLTKTDLLGQWKLKGYADRKAPIYDITIEFKEDEEGKPSLNGRSSVNFYFANYEANEATKAFKIGVLGSTKIAGSIEANQFESVYYEYLRNIEKYEFIDKNHLVFYLTTPQKETIYFERK